MVLRCSLTAPYFRAQVVPERASLQFMLHVRLAKEDRRDLYTANRARDWTEAWDLDTHLLKKGCGSDRSRWRIWQTEERGVMCCGASVLTVSPYAIE